MNSIVDFFDHTYVINLAERKDRRRLITREFEKIGTPLPSERVSIYPAIRPNDAAGFPSIGARGCFLSQLGVMEDAHRKGYETILVLEDDCRFVTDFSHLQSRVCEELTTKHWDFAYLGHGLDLPESKDDSLFSTYKQEIRLAHFFGVHAHVIERLIGFLHQILEHPPGHPDGGPMHVDGAWSTFRLQNPSVVTLVANPSFGNQRASMSDIAPLSWYDRLPGVRRVAAGVRTIKQAEFFGVD